MGGRKKKKPLTLGQCESGVGKTEKPTYDLRNCPSARNQTGIILDSMDITHPRLRDRVLPVEY